MKPTPGRRPTWPLPILAIFGLAMLVWGCGHTREILYPQRKLSPPRVVGKPQGPRRKLVEPTQSPSLGTIRPPDAPAAVDVPIIDRNGR